MLPSSQSSKKRTTRTTETGKLFLFEVFLHMTAETLSQEGLCGCPNFPSRFRTLRNAFERQQQLFRHLRSLRDGVCRFKALDDGSKRTWVRIGTDCHPFIPLYDVQTASFAEAQSACAFFYVTGSYREAFLSIADVLISL